ncbi:dethiobiotin synthase [uncultured Dokdonia sp.]|uniref:dethiobiotin synthase n=1 Tax=uncultured Dokdonia sp. TaxID=575653 RepID=UPI002608B479|nr:dethiobiotin synthase [uncultured Dokdonia sp.]
MKSTYFITGISTEVGKTIASAIVTEALQADYWKPVQAGELDNSDTHKIKYLVSNDISQYHDNSYVLHTPMSPHAAAAIDGVEIQLSAIKRPKTTNSLVIEGAGGLLVPLNDTDTIIDLIQPTDKIIIVSRHYLGSINHTLLTVEALKSRNLTIAGIIFSGDEHPTTEAIITKMTQVPIIGRIEEEPYFDERVVSEYAALFKERLEDL